MNNKRGDSKDILISGQIDYQGKGKYLLSPGQQAILKILNIFLQNSPKCY